MEGLGSVAIEWPLVHAVPLPGEHGAAQLSSWGLSTAPTQPLSHSPLSQ